MRTLQATPADLLSSRPEPINDPTYLRPVSTYDQLTEALPTSIKLGHWRKYEAVTLEQWRAEHEPPVCPYCGRVMSRREAAEQGACNDCYGDRS